MDPLDLSRLALANATNLMLDDEKLVDLRNAPLQGLYDKLKMFINVLDYDWGMDGLLEERMMKYSTHLQELQATNGERLTWDEGITRRPGFRFFHDFVLGVIFDPLIRNTPGGLITYAELVL